MERQSGEGRVGVDIDGKTGRQTDRPLLQHMDRMKKEEFAAKTDGSQTTD